MTESTNPGRIVVGVDGSPHSIAALRRGAHLAAVLDLPLEVITTWDFPPMIDAYYTAEWKFDEDAEKTLAAALDQAFEGSPPDGLRQTVLQGPAARLLIEQSRDAYMLVIGSRGHGGFVGLLLGSVSSVCATHAHCPVLIMHGD
jgi:nucleotide-binding universal stress UspA family protein